MDLKSKASQLASQIESTICVKHLRSGDPIYSEAQIMHKFSTSRSTVRRALGLLENKGILYRRKGKGTFIADDFSVDKVKPQILRADVPKEIAIVLQAVSDNFFGTLATACQKVLKSNGHHTFIVTAENREEFLRHIAGKHFDGAVINVPTEDLQQNLLGFQQKVVLVNDGDITGFNQVCSDDFQGAHMITSYLISLRHRNILHLSGPKDTYCGVKRIQGYEAAMREHQLFDEIAVEEAMYSKEVAYEKMSEILQSGKCPEAVFCGNDSIAAGVYLAAFEHNLRIPDDISVAGFGNQSDGVQLQPQLTTVDQGPQAIGQVAGKLLLGLLNGDDSNVEQIKLQSSLILRKSCKAKISN